MCRAGKHFLNETGAATNMTSSSTSSSLVAISPSNSLLAYTTSSTNVQCYNLPSCNHAFTLTTPNTSTDSNGADADADAHEYFQNNKAQSISKILVCGPKSATDNINSASATHIITQHYRATKNKSSNSLFVWDTQTTQLLHQLHLPEGTILHDVASPSVKDKSFFLVLVYIPLIQKYQVLEYDVTSGKLLRKIRAGSGSSKNSETTGRISCSDNGKFLAIKTSEQGKEIKILDRITGKRTQKLSLYDTNSNGHSNQEDASFQMRFSSDAKHLLVCHDDTMLNLYCIAPSKSSSSVYKKITLLLDNHVKQRTSVVHMDVITTGSQIGVLVTCADGTVCLFDQIKVPKNDTDKITTSSITVTSTLQVPRNGNHTPNKICIASFKDAKYMFLVFAGKAIRSHTLAFRNSKLECSLKKEEWISVKTSDESAYEKEDVDDDGDGETKKQGVKRKNDGSSKIMGPDKSGGEVLMMDSMEQIQKEQSAKKMKLEEDPKKKKKMTKEEEESVPVMLLSKKKKKTKKKDSPALNLTSNDRLEAMRQHYFDVQPLPLSTISNNAEEQPTSEISANATTTTNANDDISQKIQSLQKALNPANMSARVQTLVKLLTQAIQECTTAKLSSPTSSYSPSAILPISYTLNPKSTMLATIFAELNDLTLISQAISQLHPKEELLSPLLEHILYLSQTFTESHHEKLSSMTTRKQFSFWIKRILMEFMYEKKEDVGEILNRVQQLMKARLGSQKVLLMLEGRIAHLKESWNEKC